jgi:hypothetical protein
MLMTISPINVRISSFCHHGGCVGVGVDGGAIIVRSTREPDGPVLRFTDEEWDGFLSGVRNGEFYRSALLHAPTGRSKRGRVRTASDVDGSRFSFRPV